MEKLILKEGDFLVLVFSVIMLIIFLTASIIIFSTIQINLKKIDISNNNNKNELKYDYKIFLDLYFLNKIKFISIKIDKEKMKKLDIKKKLQKINFSNMKKELPSKDEVKELLKKLDIEVTKFNLSAEIGTEDVIITSVIIALLSASIGMGLAVVVKDYKKEKYYYKIVPLYNNKNQIKLNLNCIFKVKMVHIIYIIYVFLKKRRVDKHERTSNRRSYDYSYE